jgi:nicotinate-nucleotide pyrophosphorylase (carboxylating)
MNGTALEPGIAQHLSAAGLVASEVASLVEMTIAEDLAGGVDVTSVATVPAGQRSTLELVARQPGVTCGAWVTAAVFDLVSGHDATSEVLVEDGTVIAPGDVLVRITGLTRDLLVGERTALNFFGHLSGVATATHEWAVRLEGTRTRVRDTRKTTPLLRALEKYAVRCGGGVNHRMSLSDAALVKDNHVVAAGGVRQAFEAVRRTFPGVPVEVEVDTIEQLREVLDAGADLVMLDNFTIAQMREAVAINDGRAKLEASGGLTLKDAHDVGETGVDYVAVGALTHSAHVLDIGADLRMI